MGVPTTPPAPLGLGEPGGDTGGRSPNSEPPTFLRSEERQPRDRDDSQNRNGRRHKRNRRGRRGPEPQLPPAPVIADSETVGWFDTSRDGGFIRRASNSYLAESGDAFVPPHIVRQYALRRGDIAGQVLGFPGEAFAHGVPDHAVAEDLEASRSPVCQPPLMNCTTPTRWP